MQIPSENGGRGHNFYVWQLSEATVLMLRQIFRYGRKRGWIEHQNQLSFIRSIENWKRYECKCRSCSLVVFVWNVHLMLIQWKVWCFMKKIFKVSSTFKVPNVTLCQTENFESKQGVPQTKNCVILKRQCFLEILQVWIPSKKDTNKICCMNNLPSPPMEPKLL